MCKKALWLSLIGFVLGVGVGVMFHTLSGPDTYLAREEHRLGLMLYFLLSGVYGAVNMGTSAVYGIDSWSILKCTATHFAISVGSSLLFFGAMILMGWMAMPSLSWCLLMLAAFVAVYFLIWLLQYLAYRRRVRQMNEKLRAWRSHRKN